MRKVLILISFVIHLTGGNAQTPEQLRHFTSENGLGSQQIQCIHQDANGFIWLGTNIGLIKYDGYDFNTIKTPKTDSTSKNKQGVNCIYEDKDGVFWIGTNQGLMKFYPELNRFKLYPVNEKDNTDSASFNALISDIKEDNEGNLWLSSFDCFIKFNKQTEKFINFIHNKYQEFSFGPYFSSIELDSNNNIWLGSKLNGLYFFNQKDNKLHNIKDINKIFPEIKDISALQIFDDKVIFSTRGKGIFTIDISNFNISSLNDYNENLPDSIEGILLHQNNYWISAKDACYLLRLDQKTYQIEKTIQNGKHNTNIFIDKNNNFWISIEFSGIQFYSPNEFKFIKTNNAKCSPPISNIESTKNTEIHNRLFFLHKPSDTLVNPVYRNLGTVTLKYRFWL